MERAIGRNDIRKHRRGYVFNLEISQLILFCSFSYLSRNMLLKFPPTGIPAANRSHHQFGLSGEGYPICITPKEAMAGNRRGRRCVLKLPFGELAVFCWFFFVVSD